MNLDWIVYNMSIKDALQKRKEAKAEAKIERSFDGYPILKAIKPKERIVFHSDYFEIDDYVACILTWVHSNSSIDNFGPFYGINRIPANMPEGVTTMNFQEIARVPEKWIESHQKSAESVAETSEQENARAGTMTGKHKAASRRNDFETIAEELSNGASYLHVYDRLLVKAPDLETLESAINKLNNLYTERFATLQVTPVVGTQRQFLSNLFGAVKSQPGKSDYYTSTEFAGAYNLVTHGLNDTGGTYVGYMVGDVNNSAVLFDIDAFRHHVVVASEQLNAYRNRAHVSDMWGSKIGQAALENGHKVVHVLLGDCDMSQLGPTFESFTETIDMNNGDVNMFEMFGDVEDELAIFSSQMRKLVLMAEQAYETTPEDRSIIDGALEEIATKFYIDNRMWYENAGEKRDRLRIVGIPHDQVPRLQMFVSYLDTEYKAAANSGTGDTEQIHAMSVLRTTFRNLLSNNGDLFNTITSPVIDTVKGARRVIYDFQKLMMRGTGIAMAQLVNIIDFAVANLGEGDIVIFHGAENIVNDKERGKGVSVRDYIEEQLIKLYHRGGRAAFLYNDVDSMIESVDFNHFDKADYTLLGNMSQNTAEDYQRALGQSVPADLIRLITDRAEAHIYIRRGFDNVVFQQDLLLDIDDNVRAHRTSV